MLRHYWDFHPWKIWAYNSTTLTIALLMPTLVNMQLRRRCLAMRSFRGVWLCLLIWRPLNCINFIDVLATQVYINCTSCSTEPKLKISAVTHVECGQNGTLMRSLSNIRVQWALISKLTLVQDRDVSYTIYVYVYTLSWSPFACRWRGHFLSGRKLGTGHIDIVVMKCNRHVLHWCVLGTSGLYCWK